MRRLAYAVRLTASLNLGPSRDLRERGGEAAASESSEFLSAGGHVLILVQVQSAVRVTYRSQYSTSLNDILLLVSPG